MMKLSEAIRLGSMLKPQGFGLFFDMDELSCALTAARDAAGDRGWVEKYPFLYKSMACLYPECGECGSSLAVIIAIHLNDRHRWTREQIADYVEATFEQSTTEPTPVEVEAEVCVG